MNAAAGTPPMIVVGVDGSEASKRALRWAADQARLVGAELKVVTTWEYPPTLGWAPPYPSDFDPDEDARQALREHSPGIVVDGLIEPVARPERPGRDRDAPDRLTRVRLTRVGLTLGGPDDATGTDLAGTLDHRGDRHGLARPDRLRDLAELGV